ncbi:MAG: heavy-metal-associated domain-containing protein [Nitrospirota bacterium]
MKTVKLSVSGMTCNHCAMHVENALKELSGVKTAKVDLKDKSAEVTYDEGAVDTKKMADAVAEAGYKVE